MDLDGQQKIKEIVDKHGSQDLMVILGAADGESAALAAETVTQGDPSYAGILAGMPLGLSVYHILEPEIKEQLDPALFSDKVGFMELALDGASISESLRQVRARLNS